MPAITVSRQLGSGGAEIASMLAAKLGYRLVGKEIIDEVASRLGVSPVIARNLDEVGYDWAGELVRELMLGFQGVSLTRESYQLVASRVIREAHARENCVFLGRAAQVVLAGKSDVFHVHIVAPIEDRVARIRARDHVDTATALDRIRNSDQARQRYIWAAGQVQWDDPTIYDLVINTHRLPVSASVDIVVEAADKSGALSSAAKR